MWDHPTAAVRRAVHPERIAATRRAVHPEHTGATPRAAVTLEEATLEEALPAARRAVLEVRQGVRVNQLSNQNQ